VEPDRDGCCCCVFVLPKLKLGVVLVVEPNKDELLEGAALTSGVDADAVFRR
jgi:hypothetical protein